MIKVNVSQNFTCMQVTWDLVKNADSGTVGLGWVLKLCLLTRCCQPEPTVWIGRLEALLCESEDLKCSSLESLVN